MIQTSVALSNQRLDQKTSGFGVRSLDNHKGIDIAASGTVPIIAAADGVVIRSELSSSYGNVVYLSHRINGKHIRQYMLI